MYTEVRGFDVTLECSCVSVHGNDQNSSLDNHQKVVRRLDLILVVANLVEPLKVACLLVVQLLNVIRL